MPKQAKIMLSEPQRQACRIEGQFTLSKARQKLGRAYPLAQPHQEVSPTQSASPPLPASG